MESPWTTRACWDSPVSFRFSRTRAAAVPPLVHKGAPGRPPGQGLDAQLSRPREQVQHLPPGQLELDDIEQGLLHPVRGRPGLHPLQFLQTPPTAVPEITRISASLQFLIPNF